MPVSLIIAAGGSGTRFLSDLPTDYPKAGADKISKLFFPLCGLPLLAHTITRFQGFAEITETIVAHPPGAESEIKKWRREFGWRSVSGVRGGKTRAESVWNALKKCDPKNRWIMIHDGARPFVSGDAIQAVLANTRHKEAQGAILARKVVPTIKRSNASGNIVKETVDRTLLYEAETPQLMRRDLLENAYRKNPEAFEATDEASLLEAQGGEVRIVTHTNWNPKITTFQDMQLAQAYLAGQKTNTVRVGLGWDRHRLVSKRKLYLGGIQIPSPKGALGHSDADVLLHAVTDAILGATGEGDIGDIFSDRDPKFKGIRSTKIIAKILGDVKKHGWTPMHVDSIVTLEKPRLGERKQMIRKNLAKIMKLRESDVSVKAKTAEGLGPEGEGLSISAQALVTMQRVMP